MEHFVRIVMEKQELINRLDESIFPHQEIYETEQDATVIEIPLARQLSETESDEYAQRLANMMFEQGYTDFDIEISSDNDQVVEEITLDGNDFFEEFGVMWYNEDEMLDEAEYQGRKVQLGKPVRSSNGPKKFHVFVKDPRTKNIKKVNFGDPNMKIKKSNPARRRSFRARHNCDNPGPRTSARYWSCRAW
jgi:hypothetical protein